MKRILVAAAIVVAPLCVVTAVQAVAPTADNPGASVPCDQPVGSVATGSGAASPVVDVGGAATAQVLGSRVEDDLLVIDVEISAIVPTDFGYVSTYVNPDGLQVEDESVDGVTDLLDGAHATVTITFADSVPGGRLAWKALPEGGHAVEFVVPVP